VPLDSNSASMQYSQGNEHAAIDTLLVRAHGLAAFAALLMSVVFGILISLQFIWPELLGAFSSWGRLRYSHTQGIMLGWLGNAFIAFLYHAVPILSGRPVTSRKLGLWLFGLWNFAVMIPGWVLVLAGVSQPLEWAEFPLLVDVFVVAALGLAGVQFLPGFFKHGFENLYVSSWYIIGALVFTLLAYPMGNIVPELVPGPAGAAFSGLWIHDAVGLFVTPLALAILYFVIPASTGRPIYSHFLSMVGFWGLFFLYPLNGTHHYIFSVIPMETQATAIAASFLLGIVVIIVVSNLLLSQRGAGFIPKEISLRFASMATVFYLIVSLQGSMQANMSLNQAIHFTDWVIGHSHLAMLGFATFAAIAGLVHAWQRLPKMPYNPRLLNQAYWLLLVGISIMVIDLTIGGVVQGQLWQSGAPWLESVRQSQPYWVVRSLSAIPITLGFVLLGLGLVRGELGAGNSAAQAGRLPDKSGAITGPEKSPTTASAVRMSYIVASLAGIVFFVFSVSLLGLLPNRVLQQQTASLAPVSPLMLTASEVRGRDIYAQEGCGYCHSQQVRYTDADTARFGAPSLAWEGRFDYPHMLGTRRIGPDLARAGNTRSTQWQFLHLFSPRSVVPDSVMPSYPEFFDGSPLRPQRQALDLVAYIDTLGQARELAWPEGDAAGKLALPNDPWAQMSFAAPQLNAHPARTRPRGHAPEIKPTSDAAVAEGLWAQNCVSCHGPDGKGDGPAAQYLAPAPINLTQHKYRSELLADILWNGVYASSMPAWRDQSLDNLAALISKVQNFSEVDSDISAASIQQLRLGESVYQRNCTECHGLTGAGDGFAVANLPVPIPPTDFTREKLTLSESLRVLQDGVAGSSMAPWGDRLTEADMVAVSHYLRSLYQPVSGDGL
jgi:cytochrome c oxidase cbb3-type subunit I/II